MRSPLLLIFGALAISISAHGAVNMNGSLSYTNDFDDLNDFESGIAHWQNSEVFASGVNLMTTEGSSFNASHTTPDSGNVAPSNPNTKNSTNSNTPFTFPTGGVAPKVTASSFSSLNPRFGGNWMITQGVGNYDSGTSTWASTGSAVLKLENLGAHSSLNINMILAIGDSFDSSSGTNYDGPFEVLVDGAVVYSSRFGGGGSGIGGTFTGALADSSMQRVASGLNASPSYLERWSDNGGAGPLDVDDRNAEPWTLDSIWEFNLNLEHVSSDATIEIRHRVTSSLTDEYLAIDSLRVTAVPEPTVVMLGGCGLGLLLMRRRRFTEA